MMKSNQGINFLQNSTDSSYLAPPRPQRSKGLSTTPTMQVILKSPYNQTIYCRLNPIFTKHFQAAFLTEGVSEDDSDTVTFHDALSDDEDVLIENLPVDDFSAEQKQQEIYENIEDFSLG